MEKQKVIVIIAVAVAAVSGVSLLIFGRGPAEKQPGTAATVNGEAATTSPAAATSTTTTSTTKTTTTNGTKKTITKSTVTAAASATDKYIAATKAYTNLRFQFVNCKATPGSFTVKKGTKFMLDNRDNAAHKIAVGKTVYSLGAYGWTVATANVVGLTYITCDGGGSARITVQP